VHAEDRALRRIDDRCRHERAEHAPVGDGERAAGQFLERDRALARLAGIVGDLLLELGKSPGIRVAHDRDDQTTLGGDRHTDVVILVIDDVIAVDRGVDDRESLQCGDRGLDEEGHEPELHAVLFLEALAMARAQLLHRSQIDLVERREQRLSRLRLDQPLRDSGP